MRTASGEVPGTTSGGLPQMRARDARQPMGSGPEGHRGRGWQALLRPSRHSERERRAAGRKEYRWPAPSKPL